MVQSLTLTRNQQNILADLCKLADKAVNDDELTLTSLGEDFSRLVNGAKGLDFDRLYKLLRETGANV